MTPVEIALIVFACVFAGALLGMFLGGVLPESAWKLVRRFNRPTVYDAFYLALAQEEGCPFWTGDKRLYYTVKRQLKWIHVLEP